jgi:hypothetical protein
MSTRVVSSYGDIYPYKNDPRRTKRSLFVTNVTVPTGGYIPILEDRDYKQRKQAQTASSYDYDERVHRGSRPMHQTSFDLNYQKNCNNNFVTNTMLVSK